MNIFILDWNIYKNVQYYGNKHVIKMITESAQILSSAIHLSNTELNENVYKLTHQHHPCVKWVTESLSNWMWLKQLVIELNKEYVYRYNKNVNHLAYEKVLTYPIPNLNDIGPTPFKIVVKDKINNNVVDCYRYSYMTNKRHLAIWKKRETPKWFK